MQFTWNTSFNSFPAGSQYVSISGEALRDLKAAFYERFALEHTITEGADPQVKHEGGSITSVLFGDSSGFSQWKGQRSLFYHTEEQSLYGSSIAGLVARLNSRIHGNLKGLAADDHTQYARSAGDVTGALTAGELSDVAHSAVASGDDRYLLTPAHTMEEHTEIPGDTLVTANTSLEDMQRELTLVGTVDTGDPFYITNNQLYSETPQYNGDAVMSVTYTIRYLWDAGLNVHAIAVVSDSDTIPVSETTRTAAGMA